MFDSVLKELEKAGTQYARGMVRNAKKRVMYFFLTLIVFTMACVFLVLGFVLLASNVFPTEAVLLLTGAVLFMISLIALQN